MALKRIAIVVLLFLVTGDVAAQSTPSKKDIPAIAKAANGAIVSIIMADKDRKPIAQGSGFFVSKDLVVTNYHVIAEGSSAVVKIPVPESSWEELAPVDGVVTFDKKRDIAVIKTDGHNFRTLTLGNSDRVRVGEEVVAIGNPLSLESTVSNGIVSGVRTIEELGGKFLQITAPISPGSSGGPLFNMAGEVIGITAAGLKGGENLNFAIPVNDVKPLLSHRPTKLQDFPNETEPTKTQKQPHVEDASPKVIANERLRAFSECRMEYSLYTGNSHYSVECSQLIRSDFKEWAIQQNLDHEAEILVLNEVAKYNEANKKLIIAGRPLAPINYDGNWSAWLGRQVVERIERLNSQAYAVRIAVLKDSTTLVDKYVLHFYEATNP